MDTEYLTNLVIQKISESYYSEITIEELTLKVNTYLQKYYEDKIKMGIAKLDLKRAKGEQVSEKEYGDSYIKAKEMTIIQAYAIGACNRKDLRDVNSMVKL